MSHRAKVPHDCAGRKRQSSGPHWEADLIFGKNMTTIDTLMERHTRKGDRAGTPERPGRRLGEHRDDKGILTLRPLLRHLKPRQSNGRAQPLTIGRWRADPLYAIPLARRASPAQDWGSSMRARPTQREARFYV